MRFRVVVLSVLVISLLVVGVAVAGAPMHRVSGGGKLSLEDGTFETYGFVIKIDAEGNVKGQGSFQVHDLFKVHFEANCLSVDGNTAWLGGVVTKSSDPASAPIGLDFTWQLQDNGQGANADPDLQSFVIPTALLPVYDLGASCLDQGPLFLLGAFEWQDGNIQVH